MGLNVTYAVCKEESSYKTPLRQKRDKVRFELLHWMPVIDWIVFTFFLSGCGMYTCGKRIRFFSPASGGEGKGGVGWGGGGESLEREGDNTERHRNRGTDRQTDRLIETKLKRTENHNYTHILLNILIFMDRDRLGHKRHTKEAGGIIRVNIEIRNPRKCSPLRY